MNTYIAARQSDDTDLFPVVLLATRFAARNNRRYYIVLTLEHGFELRTGKPSPSVSHWAVDAGCVFHHDSAHNNKDYDYVTVA